MTAKKSNKANRQIGDQTTKGGLLGIACYAMWKAHFDPVLISMLMPVMSSVLAYLSTKIGDKDLACLFIPNDKE